MKTYKNEYGTIIIHYEKEDLEKLPTRILISMVHCSTDKRYLKWKDGTFEFEWDDGWMRICNENELREILRNRPHISNKNDRRRMINSMKKKNKKILRFSRYGKKRG